MKSLVILIMFFLSLWTQATLAEPIDAIIELSNGDRLHGRISQQKKNVLTFEHPVMGILKIKMDQVTSIVDFEHKAIPDELLPVFPPDQGLLRSGFLIDWKRRLEIGLNGAKGVSDHLNFRSAFDASYENRDDRWDYKLLYLYSQNGRAVSQSQAEAFINKDWLLPDSKWFYFASSRFQWDQFKDWDYRISASLGPGYEFYKSNSGYLRGRAAVGVNQTFGRNELFTVEALFGFEHGWNISEKQLLKLATTFHPSLTRIGEYRNVSTLDWSHALDFYQGLAIKLGLENEYDSQQTEGNDFRYYAAFVWGL